MNLPNPSDLFSDQRDINDNHMVKQFANPEKIEEHIRFDPTNLNDALLRLSSMYAYYGTLAAKGRMQRDGFKNKQVLLRAQKDRAIRKKAKEDGEKLTEPQIKAIVETQKAVIANDLCAIESQAVMTSLEVVRDAIKVQRDTIIQLNKNAQNELYGGMGHRSGSASGSS